MTRGEPTPSSGSRADGQHADRESDRACIRARLRALADAVDSRSALTRGHSRRVGDLAARLAATMGWPPRRVTLVREAGEVHDIGKLTVPSRILEKPGPLSTMEYAIVKEHAVAGGRLARTAFSPEQASWIRAHHERWDGDGYPDGLTGTEIPDGARVLGVADAFDAMTRRRPYRGPRSLQEALDECVAQAGHQFDPQVVRALVRLNAAEGPLAVPGAGVGRRGRRAGAAMGVVAADDEGVSGSIH